MTKKSNNTSSNRLGTFIKVGGQYVAKDSDRANFITGVRHSYKDNKTVIQLKVDKLDDELKVLQTIIIQVRKKDLKRLISLFEKTLKYETLNLEEEDVHE